MTTDPNELSQTPGTPTGQELAAVASGDSTTGQASGTQPADQGSAQGDSSASSSSAVAADQGTAQASPAGSDQQPQGDSLEDRVAALERWKAAIDGVTYS